MRVLIIFLVIFFWIIMNDLKKLNSKVKIDTRDFVYEASIIEDSKKFHLIFQEAKFYDKKRLPPEGEGLKKLIHPITELLKYNFQKGSSLVIIITAKRLIEHNEPYDTIKKITLLIEISKSFIEKTKKGEEGKLSIPDSVKAYLHIDAGESSKPLFFSTKGEMDYKGNRVFLKGNLKINFKQLVYEKQMPAEEIDIEGVFHFRW